MPACLIPAEVRATLLRLAVWVGALLLAWGVDLGALRELFQDTLLNTGALGSFLALGDVDEIVSALTVRPAGLMRFGALGVGGGFSAALAAVVTVVLVHRLAIGRWAVATSLRHLAFELRREHRATSLHYSSEHFWLRVRGR